MRRVPSIRKVSLRDRTLRISFVLVSRLCLSDSSCWLFFKKRVYPLGYMIGVIDSVKDKLNYWWFRSFFRCFFLASLAIVHLQYLKSFSLEPFGTAQCHFLNLIHSSAILPYHFHTTIDAFAHLPDLLQLNKDAFAHLQKL